MSDDDLIARWDDYVESMGSVMGEVEHMAQQMRDRIEALVKERDRYLRHLTAGAESLRRFEARAERLEAALREIADDCDADYPPSHGAIKQAARAALTQKDRTE